jgi:N-acylglucosamine 2-epimerase
MDREIIWQLKGFYESELTNWILPFWMERAIDSENGGFYNCFDNKGTRLLSRDKYTWSQGRFVWLFSRLADIKSGLFTGLQRAAFLEIARQGADFLRNHCLLAENDWRCAFLMDETGKHKLPAGCNTLDQSIFADCFVVCGFARYALAAGSEADYAFAKRLYLSCRERVRQERFNTLPYPLPAEYRAHSIPMILLNVAEEMLYSARVLDEPFCEELLEDIAGYSKDVGVNFTDVNGVIHEVIRKRDGFFTGLLGEHANPGHTLEDMWFIADAAEQLGDAELHRYAVRTATRALEIGWDESFGGLLHYSSTTGGQPSAVKVGYAEAMEEQVAGGWGDKLWWVHAEALYTTLRFALQEDNPVLLAWYQRVFDYTFTRFPNPDTETREWIQILRRDGTPQEKVVALPVKDPYHIIRALILLIELLSKAEANGKCGKIE